MEEQMRMEIDKIVFSLKSPHDAAIVFARDVDRLRDKKDKVGGGVRSEAMAGLCGATATRLSARC